VCNELGLHRQLSSSGITQFGVREESQMAITWSLDSIGLPPPFNTYILGPPATPTPITITCDIIICSKKAA